MSWSHKAPRRDPDPCTSGGLKDSTGSSSLISGSQGGFRRLTVRSPGPKGTQAKPTGRWPLETPERAFHFKAGPMVP